MFDAGGKTNFMISIRLAGLLFVLAVMAYGVYVARFYSLSIGLVWMLSALTVGWVSNMVFTLLLVLISDARKSVARHTTEKTLESAHNRYRRLHMGMGNNKAS